jgi:hypothetical protein
MCSFAWGQKRQDAYILPGKIVSFCCKLTTRPFCNIFLKLENLGIFSFLFQYVNSSIGYLNVKVVVGK